MLFRSESSPVDVKPPSARSPKDQSRSFIKPLLKSHRELMRPPFDCIALVLQGGGALGAFQAGVYQGLAEANLHPNWVAGISIGAINAALTPTAGAVEEARSILAENAKGVGTIDGQMIDEAIARKARRILAAAGLDA